MTANPPRPRPNLRCRAAGDVPSADPVVAVRDGAGVHTLRRGPHRRAGSALRGRARQRPARGHGPDDNEHKYFRAPPHRRVHVVDRSRALEGRRLHRAFTSRDQGDTGPTGREGERIRGRRAGCSERTTRADGDRAGRPGSARQAEGGAAAAAVVAASGMTRLLLVTGSTRRKSTNTAALHTASELLGEEGAIVYDALAQLPAFNPDDDHESLPPAVVTLRSAIDAAEAVVFCTPEYAGTLPGSFKN